uniref:Si:ch211-165i18.2 n=1 Tax=Cyprinus carpio TaxID=7962 RepID=A0A8C1N431_CYPCA
MFVLGLLTYIVLRAFSAQAKVVTSFSECDEFFYKATEPRGMDQNGKKICQMLQYAGFYYATLYSVPQRIPLYSAYRFDPTCSNSAGRTNNWHIEPQISQPESRTEYMIFEKDSDVDIIKGKQAISSDYSDTGYDRGHLNPNSFQCDQGRTATFTLTNAAPMDACFNRVHWKSWESTLKSFLKTKLASDLSLATAYIVTGTVPDVNVRIPQREISKDPERVTVPSHIWTAVCYKHKLDGTKSFSFGYMGRNQPEGGIILMRISNLNKQLSGLYREFTKTHTQSIEIFDDCFADNELDEVEYVFQKLMNLPVNAVMNSVVENTYNTLKRAVSSDSVPKKKVKVTELIAKLAFDSLRIYSSMAEELKIFSKSVCLIIKARKSTTYSDLRKRDISSQATDAVECQLVPEKQTAADGSPCLSDPKCSSTCQCNTGGENKPCCSSPCLYQGTLNSYRCYSGQKRIACSPQYSLITVKGKRCLENHPCATYGYDYYWCKTGHGYIKDDWDYCSPPLWSSKAKNGKYCQINHACAKYDESQPWCYTDDGKENKCCISDDCYSAVNGKTCKSDHLCGYHGEKYLWCRTTDGKWDYCCTNCG